MDAIYKFIAEHYELIGSIVLVLVSFILALVRKKPVSSIQGKIYELACKAVIAAEDTDLKGFDKLSAAIQYVNQGLLAFYPDLKVEKYMAFIGLVCEQILSTPQKKEKKG